MGALLDNVAVPHDEDQIRIADGRKTVGDDKAGAALHQAVHCGLDALLGAGVHAGGGLIQYQDAVVRQNRARNRQQLLLPLTDIGGVLVQLHLIAAGQRADKVVGVRGLGSGNDLLIGSVQPTVADILHDGALEEPCILQNHAEALAQGAAVKVPDIVAVEGDGTGVHIVEPHQQLDHRGLAGTGGADNGNLLPGLDIAAEVVDDRFVRCVAEPHMVEGDLSVNAGGVGAAGGVSQLVLLVLVQELKDAFGCGGHALQHVRHLRELLDGLGKVADILNEGLNVADRDGARCGKDAAHNGDRHIAQIAYKAHDRLHQARQKLGFPRGFVQLVICGVEVVQHSGLAVERLDDIVPGVDLLNLTVDHAEGGLLGLEVLLAEFDDHQHQRQRYRQDQKRNQRHFGADREHHDQHADHRGDAGDQLGDALVQALAERIDIVRDAGQHLANSALFKVGQRQAVDLFIDLVAEVIADLLGQAGHQPALQKAERGGEQIHPRKKEQHPPDVGKVDAADPAQLGDPTGGQRCGGFGQNLGACNVENRRKNCKYNDHDERQLIPAHGGQQLAQRALEILGALRRRASGSWHITHPPSVNSVPSGSAGCVRSPGIRGSSPSAGRGCLCRRCAPRPAR